MRGSGTGKFGEDTAAVERYKQDDTYRGDAWSGRAPPYFEGPAQPEELQEEATNASPKPLPAAKVKTASGLPRPPSMHGDGR